MFRGPPVDLICTKDLSFPYVPGHLWVSLLLFCPWAE